MLSWREFKESMREGELGQVGATWVAHSLYHLRNYMMFYPILWYLHWSWVWKLRCVYGTLCILKMTNLSLALGRLFGSYMARRDESAVASNHCQRTEDDGGRLRVSELGFWSDCAMRLFWGWWIDWFLDIWVYNSWVQLWNYSSSIYPNYPNMQLPG